MNFLGMYDVLGWRNKPKRPGKAKGRVGPILAFVLSGRINLISFRYGALHVHATVDLDNLTAYVA